MDRIGPKHHGPVHHPKSDQKIYPHEQHSAMLSTKTAAENLSEMVAENIMRPLSQKESKIRSLKGRVTRAPDGGQSYLAMRRTLQNKGSTARVLKWLTGTNTTPTK